MTVVGSAADFTEMVRTFTSGEPRFPLDFGKRVAVALRTPNDVGGALAEAIYVTSHGPGSAPPRGNAPARPPQ